MRPCWQGRLKPSHSSRTGRRAWWRLFLRINFLSSGFRRAGNPWLPSFVFQRWNYTNMISASYLDRIEFLQPTHPFPNVNDSAQINMIAFTVRIVAWIVVVLLPLLLIGIVGKKLKTTISQKILGHRLNMAEYLKEMKNGSTLKTKLTKDFAKQNKKICSRQGKFLVFGVQFFFNYASWPSLSIFCIFSNTIWSCCFPDPHVGRNSPRKSLCQQHPEGTCCTEGQKR